MRQRSLLLVAVFAFAVAAVSPRCQAADLTDAEFHRLLDELKPAPDELWRTVPWQIELLEAQQRAAGERKPIFIWAMDGHPLGCT
jgi:hypothetical protein